MPILFSCLFSIKLPSNSIFREQRVYELIRVESLHVVYSLADADILHRKSHLGLNSDRNATLGRTVKLSQYDTRDCCRLLELSRLLKGVLSGSTVQYKQCLDMRKSVLTYCADGLLCR